MKAVLAAESLSVSWQPGERVLREIYFSLFPGELVGVIGASGCGKSTFCLALAGIIPRHLPGQVEGKILLAGQDIAQLNRAEIAGALGIVFQDPETQLFLTMVKSEIAFGPENLCLPQREIAARVHRVAAELGCQHLLAANPNELSGGQQQLVALASVLALEPKVLILDEVTSQLDPDTTQRIQAIIEDLRRRQAAVLMVAHDLSQLATADRVLLLRDGALEAVGELENQDLSKIYRGGPR
jgi:energy-coupling factor transport system ATP-binding protein